MSAAGANTFGMDSAGFASDIDAETDAYMKNQKQMFTAEMRAQNKQQAESTNDEFVIKMNDAAWKTASSDATDKIQ